MKALVLAAGMGMRLRPLTHGVPKALIPVLNVPLIEFALEALAEAEIGEALVNAHHCAEAIRDFSEKRESAPALEVVVEEKLLGTGGALRNVADRFRGNRFLITNADVLHGFDLREAITAHQRSGAPATLLVRSRGWERTGGFHVNDRGHIGGYLAPGESPPAGNRGVLFTGVHVLEPEVLAELPDERIFCIVQRLYRPLLEKGAPVAAHFVDESPWEDLGTPERYLDASLRLLAGLDRTDETLSRRARWILSRYGYEQPAGEIWQANPGGPRLAPAGVRPPALVGREVAVASGAEAGPAVILGDRVHLETGAHLSRCLAWPGARVPAGRHERTIFSAVADPIRL